MPKAIAFIPHKERIKKHKIEYLRAISDAMEFPWQAEDGRDQSPIQQKLGKKCAELSGIPYWTFTNCCTDSLQIAVEAVTKVDDIVIVPVYGWRGFANAVAFMKRTVEFCDIDDTGNIDLNCLRSMIKHHRPKAVIIVHNFGTITDISEIKDICDKWDVKIIEDAAPSFYMGEPYSYKPGTCADITCYSFDFTKSPGTLGSGGGIATADVELFDTIYQLQAHGIDKQKNIVRVGTKSFLDNTSSAVLLTEINLFEQNNYRESRRQAATFYDNNLPFEKIPGENYIYERYSIKVPSKQVEDVLSKLHDVKCLARTMFKDPINSYSFYQRSYRTENVIKFTNNLIHLPCHQFLTDEELNRIISAVT